MKDLGPTPAVALFFRTCVNAGKRRENDKRDFWTTDEWAAWCKRGRAAFGASPRALFGQLALIETMLEHGLNGAQIAKELREMDVRRAEGERKRSEVAAVEFQRARKRSEEVEIEEAVRKERVRLEARRRTAAERDEADAARPSRAKRSIVSIGDDR